MEKHTGMEMMSYEAIADNIDEQLQGSMDK